MDLTGKPWEVVGKIIRTDTLIDKSDLAQINKFILNRGVAGNVNGIYVANELNKQNVTNTMYADFIQNFFDSYFRPKWHKGVKKQSDVEFLMQHYQINQQEAEEYMNLLTKKDINKLKKQYGGKCK